jgi:hypothetical protein
MLVVCSCQFCNCLKDHVLVAACFVPNVHDKGCLGVMFALPRTEIMPPDKTSLTITAYANS